MSSAGEEHRVIAGAFTDRVNGVGPGGWDKPAPCPGWVARDVVRHLIDWFGPFLAGGTGIELAQGPSVDHDPAAAWRSHSDAVQALLDDPQTPSRILKNPHLGELPLDQAISMVYSADVFMHTWDLARATGQDENLDPARCAQLLEGMVPIESAMRQSGHFGPRVEVADDADAQTRLLAFIGRTP